MDRTSWIGVIVCVILLFTWGWWSAKEGAKTAAAQAEQRALAAEAAAQEAETAAKLAPVATEATDEPPAAGSVPEEKIILENDYVRLHFTNRGGSLEIAEMKKHAREVDGDTFITINENASHGVGTLSSGPGEFDISNWTVAEKTASLVRFETTSAEGLSISKTYTLPGEGADPYEVTLEMGVQNATQGAVIYDNQFLYAGSAAPLHLHEWSIQIGMYWMDLDSKFEYETVDHYGGKKVMGIFGKNEIASDTFAIEELQWAGVNDQFFTTLIKAETPYPTTLWGSRFPIVVENDEEESIKKRMFAAEAAVGLPPLTLNAGATETLRYDIYLGPKEYSRLKALGDQIDRVMHYDEIPIMGWLFGWAIKPLAAWLIQGLVLIEGLVGDYGIAIILITLAIRLLIWPVYAKSARSMKRMSKLSPKMKELKEKYPDDPQKVNEETMKLYRTYKINPLGGCLPMFIQLPVFLAFYRMLWSAVEVRHESFLWIDDLSMPDTMFYIPGTEFPINLLPILMGLTSFIQIAITPKTGDKTQQMIFMFMPLIFLVICYNFAAALALYWTTSNAFSILQTWIMNKMPEPELKKAKNSGKPSFMERMQAQAEAAQKAKAAGGSSPGPAPGKSRTAMPGEKGDRHTKSKKKKR